MSNSFPRPWRRVGVAAVLGAMLTGACSDDDPAGPGCAVQSVTVTGLPAELPALQTVTLTANVQSTGCTGLQPTWSASEGLSIDQQGNVRGELLGGPFTVTATVQGLQGSAQTTVVPVAPTDDDRWALAWISAPGLSEWEASLTGYPYAATTGTAIRSTRSGPGRNTITFEGLGAGDRQWETVHVTPYGTEVRRCRVLSWGTQGADLVVETQCNELDGTPADGRFDIIVVPAGSLTGRTGFVTTPADLDDPLPAATTFNSAGEPITIRRDDVGIYRVRFHGLSRSAVPGSTKEMFHVTSYGEGTNWCKIQSWDPAVDETTALEVVVRCFTAGGQPADARFSVLLLEGARPGVHRLGYVWTDAALSDSQYTPDAAYNFSSSGGLNTAIRNEPGVYTVGWSNLARPSDDVAEINMVTTYGTDDAHCQVRSWGGASVNVRCYAPDGSPANSRFVAWVIE